MMAVFKELTLHSGKRDDKSALKLQHGRCSEGEKCGARGVYKKELMWSGKSEKYSLCMSIGKDIFAAWYLTGAGGGVLNN